ncbi:MAG: hypothetical protein M1822_009630 [Bathelium mastoideum]|nr:MAG: hypothetical protein M1822_009630 [Bathelium mastoideum]
MDPLPPDPYEALGVPKDANLATIKTAYRKLVLKHHPDKVTDVSLKAQKVDEFHKISLAWNILSDEERRAYYDSSARLAALKKEVREHDLKEKTAKYDVRTAYTPREKEIEGRVRGGGDTDANSRAYEDRYPEGRTQKKWEYWSPLKDREKKKRRETERENFVAFALKLFDERQEQDNGKSASPNVKSMPPSPPPSKAATHGSSSIEESIKERNRAFKKLKEGGRPRSADSMKSKAEKPVQKETLYAVPVDQLNLETMNPKQDDARVDIVAVHGLGAIPDITWKEKSSGINWLSHETMLPSATPEARILRFGYDSLWMGKTPIRTSLSTIAYKLLLSLSMIRMEDLQRPLIFIGHCFGGLVIQRALNLAKMQQGAYPGVFDSSIGIVFLGTPHRGTKSFTQESALLATIAASSDLSQNLETAVLDSMTSDNGALLDVADDFIALCVDGGPTVSCFFEQRASKLGKVIGRSDIDEFIVDHTSATFDGHQKYGLELDHFSLNKFNGPDNPHYVQVRAEISRFYQAALRKAERPSELAPVHSSTNKAAPLGSTASTESSRPSQTWARLSRRPASPDLRRPDSPATRPNSIHGRVSSQSRPQSVIVGGEDELRKQAIKELQEEEAKKRTLLHEEQVQKRFQEEKRAAEQQYLERLKRNMAKYGIENPDEILAVYPLPDDKDLTQQEIKDKDKWYKNLIKGELSAVGLDTGQIDEILNDTGELMVIDEIETTFTKMAKKWISTRTLNQYKIPWQDDKDDESALLIKRWVPHYEREFLWDHSQAVRENRGRKPYRDPDRAAKAPKRLQEISQTPLTREKDWLSRMMDAFKDTQKKGGRKATEYEKAAKEYLERSKRDEGRPHPPPERPRRSDSRARDREEERDRAPRSPYDWYTTYSRPTYTPRKSTPIKSTGTTTPPSFQRTASYESVRSAPDVREVDKRRRNSQALSRSREREPIARKSGELSRRNSYDGRTRRSPSPRFANTSPRERKRGYEKRSRER